jgi:glycine dehydrogenase subunit 2
MLNRQGRPSAPQAHGVSDPAAGMPDEAAKAQGDRTRVTAAPPQLHPTFTGNKALAQVEPLLFEIGRLETTGVDLDEPRTSRPASAASSARTRSACRACRSPRPCGTTCA